MPLMTLLAIPATAATYFVSETSTVGTVVPDNDDVGVVDAITISGQDPGVVVDLSVNLVFSGGWNGDLYCYLVSDTGFTVLLNRPGRTSSNPDGAASSGMDITLADGAATDVHVGLPLSGANVTGTFQPDGRETDPASVLDTDARTALFDSFHGIDPNGTWTLFVADQAAGATSTLESWTLNLTVIPEPESCVMFGLAAMLLLRRKRSRWEGRR